MNINLTKARAVVEYVTEVETPYIRLSLTFWTDDSDYGYWFGTYSLKTTLLLIEHLRGNVDWGERVAFDDLSRVAQVDSESIRLLHFDNQPRVTITYPGHALACMINKALTAILRNLGECTIEISEEEAQQTRHYLSPQVKLFFHDDAADTLWAIMNTKHADRVRDLLTMRILSAQALSDGDEVVVNIYTDPIHQSLHFVTNKGGETVRSGGIIYHKDLDRHDSHS